MVTHPTATASNWIRVPRAVRLPPASFGFRLAADTLALGYGRRLPAPIPDFHRRDDAHAGRTSSRPMRICMGLSQIRTCGSSHPAPPASIPFGDEVHCKWQADYLDRILQTICLALRTAHTPNRSFSTPSFVVLGDLYYPTRVFSFRDGAFSLSSSSSLVDQSYQTNLPTPPHKQAR